MRNSGVQVPNSDGENSFEDAKENPTDPVVIKAALAPIPEEEASHSSDSEREEVEEGNQAPGQNMPPQVDPNAPNAVQPQQLNALLQFDGNRGEAYILAFTETLVKHALHNFDS